MKWFPEDWPTVFVPEAPIFELIVRGAFLYIAILALMRILPRRIGGELATMDLIFLLLIAEAAAHAMGDYSSIADGMIVVITFVVCAYLVNALSYRVKFIERLVSSPPLQIVKNGKIIRRNLRAEFITEEELTTHLREQGIDDLSQVKAAYVEGEGKITALT